MERCDRDQSDWGAFLGAKHQIAEMLKHGAGSIIFTSTFVGYSFAFPGVAAYAASKSGLIGLTQLAAEFGPQGIRVYAILPGAVDTAMYREMNSTPESQSFITNLHALKRVGTPEEIARSVLYLASRRFRLCQRHCVANRWRGFDHAHLNRGRRVISLNHKRGREWHRATLSEENSSCKAQKNQQSEQIDPTWRDDGCREWPSPQQRFQQREPRWPNPLEF